jgi:hypothetical protein
MSSQPDEPRDYFRRVIENESTRKGAAAAVAGVVIAALVEAMWPTA